MHRIDALPPRDVSAPWPDYGQRL